MKLTLVNKCGVSMEYGQDEQGSSMRWFTAAFMDITPPDLLNKQDTNYMKRSLIWSKINESNKISVEVFLISEDGEEGEILQVQSPEGYDDVDIFMKLRKMFGDKVKVSVCINVDLHPIGTEGSDVFIIQQGLVIGTSDICNEKAERVNEFNPRETCFRVMITADVEDDHEVIRQAEEKLSAPLKTTRKILEEGLDSNVVIVTGSGAEIKSHKCFLTASSAVIERMFANEMEESKTGRLDMTDLSEEGVKAFLRFIYCGDKIEPEADLNLAFELLYASHKYEVTQLEEFMISYWMGIENERIDVNCAFKTYMFVRGIEIASRLKSKLVRILHRKHDELKVLPEYKDLCKTPMVVMEFCEDLVKISFVVGKGFDSSELRMTKISPQNN